MKASDLNSEEKLALMGLLKLTISADLTLSPQEAAQLRRIADDMGQEAFRQARDIAKDKLTARSDIERAVRAVERPEAQRLIYGYAYEAACSDQLIPAELDVLHWAARVWSLEVGS